MTDHIPQTRSPLGGSLGTPFAICSRPIPNGARVERLSVPSLDAIDFAALRAGRLARLQTMLARHDFPVALLYSTANIRYATGVDVMAVWTAGTFARYCLVPAHGEPIPGIPYPDDDRGPRRIMPKRELKENMVLCLE